MYYLTNIKKQITGLSLIEMMVALAVSSILLLGVATVYTASKRSYQVNNEIAVLQENARFALNAMTREIRMAGYTGCQNIDGFTLNILSRNPPPGFPIDRVSQDGIPQTAFGQNNFITGHTNLQANCGAIPPMNAGLRPTDCIAGTDAITIRKMNGCSAGVLRNNNGASMQVGGGCGFNRNQAVAVTNCGVAYMFTITNAPQRDQNGETTLVFGPGDNIQTQQLNRFNRENRSRIFSADAVVYYIGTDAAGNNLGLWENRLASGGVAVQRLLIPNVLNMVINYGVDTVADAGPQTNSVDIVVPANQVGGLPLPAALIEPGDTPWSRVTRVGLRLLIASDEVGNSPKPFTFNNVNFDGVGGPLPNDNRYRREFISAVNLRNRTP